MPQPALLYYDNKCGLCITTARWVARLDLLQRIELRDSLDDAARTAGITEADIDRSMYLVCPSGEKFAGFRALRQILLRLPAMWPVVPLAWIPGSVSVGVRLYHWVADHRTSVSRRDGADKI